MKGCFVVFEGIDRAGKGVQLTELGKKLQAENYKVVLTKEPTTNRPIGRLIRNVLYKDVKVSDEALALLFAADRADHTKGKIIPALKKGAVVLSDRYVYSSLAYQGKGMSIFLNLEWLKIINRYAISPDIVVFLDIPPEVGLIRHKEGQQRVQDDAYFEDLIKQEKIRSVYYKILNLERTVKDLWEFQENKKKKKNKKIEVIKLNDTQVLRINGTLAKEEIHKEVYKFVKNYLEEKQVPLIKKIKPKAYKLIQFTNNAPKKES